MCWTELKIKQVYLLSLSTTLQTPSRKAWERKDCSKPLTLKKEPNISLDMDFQTFAQCPAPLLGQVGPQTREGLAGGPDRRRASQLNFGPRDRDARGPTLTGVGWALCMEAKLLNLCVPVSTNTARPPGVGPDISPQLLLLQLEEAAASGQHLRSFTPLTASSEWHQPQPESPCWSHRPVLRSSLGAAAGSKDPVSSASSALDPHEGMQGVLGRARGQGLQHPSRTFYMLRTQMGISVYKWAFLGSPDLVANFPLHASPFMSPPARSFRVTPPLFYQWKTSRSSRWFQGHKLTCTHIA